MDYAFSHPYILTLMTGLAFQNLLSLETAGDVEKPSNACCETEFSKFCECIYMTIQRMGYKWATFFLFGLSASCF